MERTILHSDINCCYAAIEHLHHPELAGKPLGAAIALELMLLILICMTLMNRFTNGDETSGGMIV